MIKPIQGNLLIEPVVQETVWETSQTSLEERGKVLAVSFWLWVKSFFGGVKMGDFVYFDSWQAARFKGADEKDVWLVNIDAVRAVEHDS